MENGSVVKNVCCFVFCDLDELFDFVWDLVDLSGYCKIWQEGWGFFLFNIVIIRGCFYKCNWCVKLIYGNCYNL